MKKLLFFVLLFASSCATLVEQPRVGLKDVRFAGFGPDGITIDFLLTVTNPNSFDLPLNGYSYDLRLMALPLARGESRESLSFGGNSSTDMLIPVKIAYNDAAELLKRGQGLKDLPYQLNANLDVGTPMGDVKVPVKKGGVLSVPEKYRPGTLLKRLDGLLNNRL